MKHPFHQIISTVVAGAMVLSTPLSLSAVAANTSPDSNTPKQEVVYADLALDGSVSQVYVVNIFDMSQPGQIVDFGNYTKLRNMTTTDAIESHDDKITIQTNGGKIYYEGTLEGAQLPWLFQIDYTVDGIPCPADEVGGTSGALQMHMTVRQNPQCRGTFFDDYALQISFTLDTEKCANIVADGATQANVGKNRQLTYTILPGTEEDIVITTNVTDFEMPAVAINGVSLSLNITVDDDELMDKVRELLDGIEELDDGAGELKDGVDELQDGVENDLQSGAEDLDDGADELRDGAGELKDGGKELNNGAYDLRDGVRKLDDGLSTLDSGILQVEAALKELNSHSPELQENSKKVLDALNAISTALDKISISKDDLQNLAAASTALQQGLADFRKAIELFHYEKYDETVHATQLYNSNEATIIELEAQIKELDEQIENLSSSQTPAPLPILPPVTEEPGPGENLPQPEIGEPETSEIEQKPSNEHDEEPLLPETEKNPVESNNSEHSNTEKDETVIPEVSETIDQEQPQALPTEPTEEAMVNTVVSNTGYTLCHTATIPSAVGYSARPLSSQDSSEDLKNQLIAQRNQLQIIVDLLKKNNEAITGTKNYFATVTPLVEQLQKQCAVIDSAVANITSTLNNMLIPLLTLKASIQTLAKQYALLNEGIVDYTNGVAQIIAGYTQVTGGASQLMDGSQQLRKGADNLYDGTAELLRGIVEIYDGTGTLKDGTGELKDGVADLLEGVITLNDGALEMKDGTWEMRDKTSGMDTEISDQIDELISSISGGDKEVISFVSEENTNIESVQFVIKTAPVELPEVPVPESAPAPQPTFWQKLKNLFSK